MMQGCGRFGFWGVVCMGMLVSVATAQWIESNKELQAGMQASNQGRRDEAIAHFEKAVGMDPSNGNAQLYLATAYAQQYTPGVDKPDNIAMAERAIDHYQKVVEIGASRLGSRKALKGIAFLDVQMGRLDEAKDWYGKAEKLDPNDSEPYYLTGVVDWTQASQFREGERAKLGMKPVESLGAKDKKVCITVREKIWPYIGAGTDSLNRALELNPTYEDAMTYMALLYRERADVQCIDPGLRTEDMKTADAWTRKADAAKKSNAIKQKGAAEED